MVAGNFIQVIDNWIDDIKQYNYQMICTQPAENSWSLGQVCMHLISETNHFLKQARICATTNDDQTEEMSANARWMFQNEGFPDEKIEGPATNTFIPQPESKQQLIELFAALKSDIRDVELLVSKSLFRGKTKHPGLNYFDAAEWLYFAQMHIKHHLRQKNRIDDFLKANA